MGSQGGNDFRNNIKTIRYIPDNRDKVFLSATRKRSEHNTLPSNRTEVKTANSTSGLTLDFESCNKNT